AYEALFFTSGLQVIISNAVLWPGGIFKSYILLLRIIGSIDRNIGIKHKVVVLQDIKCRTCCELFIK
ncbi:hypothetical protein HMPREF1544_09067, partial [Mucor circinelloides 1006PhL]